MQDGRKGRLGCFLQKNVLCTLKLCFKKNDILYMRVVVSLRGREGVRARERDYVSIMCVFFS